MILFMPNWHVTVRGNTLHLVHSKSDDELDRVGAWEIVLWRGAPSWESDPELEHAALGVMLAEPHRRFIRHAWTFDIPDRYLGARNTGDDRQWMTLQGQMAGGSGWQIVLQFPRFTPAPVFAAVAAGFHAQLGEAPVLKVVLPATARPDAVLTFQVIDDPVVASVDPTVVAEKVAQVRQLTPAARAAI